MRRTGHALARGIEVLVVVVATLFLVTNLATAVSRPATDEPLSHPALKIPPLHDNDDIYNKLTSIEWSISDIQRQVNSMSLDMAIGSTGSPSCDFPTWKIDSIHDAVVGSGMGGGIADIYDEVSGGTLGDSISDIGDKVSAICSAVDANCY